MKYTTPPTSVRSLEQRIRNFESTDSLVSRRRVAMALVVVSQMLPEGVVKGGSAMALRFGRNTRFTRDLDAARISSLENFRSAFEDRLTQGWAGFTGRLIIKKVPAPSGIPTAYVMQPFEVKLDFHGKSWCTVSFELGHDEIGDSQRPTLHSQTMWQNSSQKLDWKSRSPSLFWELNTRLRKSFMLSVADIVRELKIL